MVQVDILPLQSCSLGRSESGPEEDVQQGIVGRGPMKAIVAVAASMLTAAYYMLRDGQDYHGLGAAHFRRADHARLVAGLTRRLHHLGYEVTLRPAA
jgi:hypothetical protein